MGYAIKDSYTINPAVCYFLDDVTTTRGIVFQPDVYTFAEWCAELAGITRIVDVGAGWGDKLAGIHNRHPDWAYEGVDFGANLAHCRTTHPWATWHNHDLEIPFPLDAAGAVAICSDVIEHVSNPVPLVHSLRDSGATTIIISTPERDVQYGAGHNGPPPNPCHIREWNGEELARFLRDEGLTVRHVGLTRGNDRGTAMATQLVVCTP